MTTLPLLPQASQLPPSQTVMMKTSTTCGIRCWSFSVTWRLACAGDACGRSLYSQRCTLMPFCIRFFHVIKLKKVSGMMNMSWLDDMIQKMAAAEAAKSKGRCGRSPSLTHMRFQNFRLRRPIRLTNSLTHALRCTGGKNVTVNHRSVSSDLADRQCRPRTSTASTLASLKHYSLRLLREFHFVSCQTEPILVNSEGGTAP